MAGSRISRLASSPALGPAASGLRALARERRSSRSIGANPAPPGPLAAGPADGPDPNEPDLDRAPSRTVLFDAALRIGLVAALIYACSRILSPLLEILVWSAILAVMLYPLHRRLLVRVGERWSALLIGIVGVSIMVVPAIVVVTSVGSSVYGLFSDLQSQTLVVPPPPARLARIPLIGQALTDAWALVATNAPAALAKYSPALKRVTAWLFSFTRRLAAGELSFVLSFGIAAALVAYGRDAAAFTQRLLVRLTGSKARGAQLAVLTVDTIRGVALGIVGVAVIQALLLGAAFFAVRLPAAGLLTLATFFLCILQVPTILLTLPIIAYVCATEPAQTAVIFSIWALVAGLSDNVLKPLLLGRGLEVPMPIILIGVIGGMIADGLLGLFVGPVLLAAGYALLIGWLRQPIGEPLLETDPAGR